LEERVGERRPITLLDAAVRGDIPAGCRTNISGVLAENGAGASDHRDAFAEQAARARSSIQRSIKSL
jgi:hypothetical protein